MWLFKPSVWILPSLLHFTTSFGLFKHFNTRNRHCLPFIYRVRIPSVVPCLDSSSRLSMSTTTDNNEFTTNEEDQKEVAKLNARLQNAVPTTSTLTQQQVQTPLPSVDIAEGTHKYVLILAEYNGDEQYIVTSKRNAQYHRNAAEPMITKLEQHNGYSNIQVTGGGRITYNPDQQTIHIYGFSYGFGIADHAISQSTILNDPRYSHYTVTYSNDGY